MPRSKSVLKRQRQTITRTQRNKGARSSVRTLERKVREATTPDEARDLFKDFQKAIDQAAAKGVVHRNKAARRKARLAKVVEQKG